MSTDGAIGVIGGSGLYELEGLNARAVEGASARRSAIPPTSTAWASSRDGG